MQPLQGKSKCEVNPSTSFMINQFCIVLSKTLTVSLNPVSAERFNIDLPLLGIDTYRSDNVALIDWDVRCKWQLFYFENLYFLGHMRRWLSRNQRGAQSYLEHNSQIDRKAFRIQQTF